MTTHYEERDVFQSHCFDPFPEPRTFPTGWDVDAILSAPKPAPAQEVKDFTGSESSQSEIENPKS